MTTVSRIMECSWVLLELFSILDGEYEFIEAKILENLNF